MNDKINMDSSVVGSVNEKINMDSSAAGSVEIQDKHGQLCCRVSG